MNAIWIAVAAVSLLGLAFGAILGYASRRFAVEDDPVVEQPGEDVVGTLSPVGLLHYIRN